MVARQLATAALGVVAALAPALGQRPATLKDIPLYPGAAPPPAGEDLPSPQLGISPDTSRLYLIKAPIEAVVRFYQQRLSARELGADEFAKALERVDAEPVAAVFSATPHDFRSPAEAMLKSAVTSRPPYRPGQWLGWAGFVWSRRQANGQIVWFGVSMVDGYDVRRPKEQGTVLAVGSGVSGGPGDAVDEAAEPTEPEEGRAGDDTAPPEPRSSLKEPSPAELGVPRYPGASFDGRGSAGMSSSGDRYLIYTSPDPPEKVVAFYGRQTGKTAVKSPGGWMIAVKGSGLFPELGLTVQPNVGTYPGAVRTIITVRHGGAGK